VKYDGRVKVTVTRTYDIILETEVGPGTAHSQEAKVAFDQIRYYALGMKQADLDALDSTTMQAGCYQGEETTVVDVWDVREAVEDEEEVVLEREAMAEAEEASYAAWATQDPDAAERHAAEMATEEDE